MLHYLALAFVAAALCGSALFPPAQTFAQAVVPAAIPTPSAPPEVIRWLPSVDATPGGGTNVIGTIEQPAAGRSYDPDSGIPVSGWVVDRYSATRPDRVFVYDAGPPEVGGQLLAEAQPFVWRFDVGNLLGSSAYKVSGFEGTIPPHILAPRDHTLVVAAHLGALGWWTTIIHLRLSSAAPPPFGDIVRRACFMSSGAGDADVPLVVTYAVPLEMAAARP